VANHAVALNDSFALQLATGDIVREFLHVFLDIFEQGAASTGPPEHP